MSNEQQEIIKMSIQTSMESKKQMWIKQVLDSADTKIQIEISENLKQRLERGCNETIFMHSRMPLKTIWLAAASILILITFNFTAVKYATEKKDKQETNSTIEYFSYLEQVV
jgi:porphobilinogen deaminase